MTDIRIQTKCARCKELFEMRVCASFQDLCKTCQGKLGIKTSEDWVRYRNDLYRNSRERFQINSEGDPLNAFSSLSSKGSVSFLPGLRADAPAPPLQKMREAIKKVRSSSLEVAKR